jgi:hypothetical protein
MAGTYRGATPAGIRLDGAQWAARPAPRTPPVDARQPARRGRLSLRGRPDGRALVGPVRAGDPCDLPLHASRRCLREPGKEHRNYGGSPALRTSTRPRLERSYLRFAVAGLVGEVTAARLRLHAETASQTGYEARTVAGQLGRGYDQLCHRAGTRTGRCHLGSCRRRHLDQRRHHRAGPRRGRARRSAHR